MAPERATAQDREREHLRLDMTHVQMQPTPTPVYPALTATRRRPLIQVTCHRAVMPRRMVNKQLPAVVRAVYRRNSAAPLRRLHWLQVILPASLALPPLEIVVAEDAEAIAVETAEAATVVVAVVALADVTAVAVAVVATVVVAAVATVTVAAVATVTVAANVVQHLPLAISASESSRPANWNQTHLNRMSMSSASATKYVPTTPVVTSASLAAGQTSITSQPSAKLEQVTFSKTLASCLV